MGEKKRVFKPSRHLRSSARGRHTWIAATRLYRGTPPAREAFPSRPTIRLEALGEGRYDQNREVKEMFFLSLNRAPTIP
ncbi:unnamed protein product [Zymoseptoria tritici ST99CH_3D7]|uniref:Uncharacterized protein n=1 Tax=Zymoseptoria tritici (strain ST99CH_3D7) TaxID=1276538 RepID=A0A1X7RGS7_ZYMT9|nr:unnamed protein product [Zymoseptoria tritici ST99CH_3D7]